MTLASDFAADKTTFSVWSTIPDPQLVEAVCDTPFDALTLDMQHGAHSEETVWRCLPHIINKGKPAIVRIPVGRFDIASRALDFGADAVIAPMINSAADARAFAAAMKYPPLGERSWGPPFALMRQGITGATMLSEGNRRTMALAMIETRRAYEAADDILAVDGIDGIFVGPSDFSIAWTKGAKVDHSLEDMMEAIASLARRTIAAGKRASIFAADTSLVGRLTAMGYRHFGIALDTYLLRSGAATILGNAKASAGATTPTIRG